MTGEKMYTADEVAELCRVTPWTVREWCKKGTLPATRPGRSWLIKESDLTTFLRARHG